MSKNTENEPATNTYNRPWSVVPDDELAKLRLIAAKAKGLARGCNCDYDYRCGNCQLIIEILDIVDPTR